MKKVNSVDIKKLDGFTLAEVLVTLTLIGVITMLTLPTIFNRIPDKDRTMYKKDVYLLQNAVNQMVSDGSIYTDNTRRLRRPVGYDESESAVAFCENLSRVLHTVGGANCGNVGTNSPMFTTPNGTRWLDRDGNSFSDADNKTITLLINNTELRINVRFDGKVFVDDSWTKEREYLTNPTKLKKD